MTDTAPDAVEGAELWQDVARKHWLRKSDKQIRVQVDVIKKDIWDKLEEEQFDYSSLLALESLQLLERHAHL